jgi:hypothetical protein
VKKSLKKCIFGLKSEIFFMHDPCRYYIFLNTYYESLITLNFQNHAKSPILIGFSKIKLFK